MEENVQRTKAERQRREGGGKGGGNRKKEGKMGKLNHVCIRMGEGEKAKTCEVSDENPSSSQRDGLWPMHDEV